MSVARESAWVTVAYSEETCLQALVLAKSLRRVVTAAKTVVLITEEIEQSLRIVLSDVFDVVLCLQVDLNSTNLSPLDKGRVFAWSLTMYQKCIVVDPHLMVVKNSDELFEMDDCLIAAASDLTVSMFVSTPAYALYIKMISTLKLDSLIYDGEFTSILKHSAYLGPIIEIKSMEIVKKLIHDCTSELVLQDHGLRCLLKTFTHTSLIERLTCTPLILMVLKNYSFQTNG